FKDKIHSNPLSVHLTCLIITSPPSHENTFKITVFLTPLFHVFVSLTRVNLTSLFLLKTLQLLPQYFFLQHPLDRLNLSFLLYQLYRKWTLLFRQFSGIHQSLRSWQLENLRMGERNAYHLQQRSDHIR